VNRPLYPFLQQRFRVTFVRLLGCSCRPPPAESSLMTSSRPDGTTCRMARMTRAADPTVI